MQQDDYLKYDATGLAELVRARDVSIAEIVDAAIARAEAVNPKVNAIVTSMYDDARAQAKGPIGGALAGVPFLIKDLNFVKGVRCTMGSRLWRDFVPDHDGEIVSRYRKAGLVFIGKSNTPEVGLAPTTESVMLGPCRSPWDLSRTPGGSSGGAAAAVAAGIVPAAHATDGGGSIRIPASFCGIYGLKPSFGRVPHGPGFPGWRDFSVTGPMTRTVRDAALMLDVLAGPDERDRYSLPMDAGPSFLSACDGGLEGLSIGWSVDLGYARVDPEVAELCAVAAGAFEELGCHVEVVTPGWENPEEIFRTIGPAETHAAWRDRLADSAELLDRSFVAVLKHGSMITIEQYLDAARRRAELWTEVQRFLARFDLLITPTVAVPAFPVARPAVTEIDGEPVSPLGWLPFCFPFNLTGQPAATVPVGMTESGLPVGLQIVGRRFAERAVLAASAAFEAAHPWGDRRPTVD